MGQSGDGKIDALVDKETRVQIMENCGYNCAGSIKE